MDETVYLALMLLSGGMLAISILYVLWHVVSWVWHKLGLRMPVEIVRTRAKNDPGNPVAIADRLEKLGVEIAGQKYTYSDLFERMAPGLQSGRYYPSDLLHELGTQVNNENQEALIPVLRKLHAERLIDSRMEVLPDDGPIRRIGIVKVNRHYMNDLGQSVYYEIVARKK